MTSAQSLRWARTVRHSERSEESLFHVCLVQSYSFVRHQKVSFTDPNNENKVLPP